MTTHTLTPQPTVHAPRTTTPEVVRTPTSTGSFIAQLILGSMVGVTLLIALGLSLAGTDLGHVIGIGVFSGFWVGGGFGLIAAGIFAEPEQ